MKRTTGGQLRNLTLAIPPGGEVVFITPEGRRLELAYSEVFNAQIGPGPKGKPKQKSPAVLMLGLKESTPQPAA